uniref:DUF4220 domain-containing protein n=1 Tax=Oryza brachyantha TaxID=4533 RepID=J3KWP1_ORYBR
MRTLGGTMMTVLITGLVWSGQIKNAETNGANVFIQRSRTLEAEGESGGEAEAQRVLLLRGPRVRANSTSVLCADVDAGVGAREWAGVSQTGSNKTKLTMTSLMQVWDKWEIQLMLFLLLTGRLRRRNINPLLRVLVWLAYVGADLVAAYALGLFSHYEEKYILGKHSFEDTLPLLWVTFLLVHLGGQDSITAFSIEDNNLWLRHLLNLGIQGALSMYIFWKSIGRINWRVLITAAFIFVSGVMKYGERIWALKSGSRDGLGKSSMLSSSNSNQNEQSHGGSNENGISSNSSTRRASYALQTVLLARGLFIGRTVLQLGNGAQEKLGNYFKTNNQELQVEEKLKILVTELGMMFDLLYTKAMVLQSRAGRVFRCAAQFCMIVAFILFLQAEKHAGDNCSSVNIAISYTLFVGAIFIESCSVAMVLASPWTRAHLEEETFLHCLVRISSNACSHFKAILCDYCMQWLSPSSGYSIGQFNLADLSISHASTSRMTCKIINVLGLGKQWIRLWHMKRVEAQGIFECMVEWFDRSPEERFGQLHQLGRRLNYTLCLPFEHAIYRLHIYTDLHISRHFDSNPDRISSHSDATIQLKEECEKLSNYMNYLVKAYPSMLPVSTMVDGGVLVPATDEWKRNADRLRFLEYEEEHLVKEPDSACPFEPALENEAGLELSLQEIKEMWTRLLVYAAGKCSGELHARRLADGLELLTFVWLLMIHHGLGDAATEVKLLTSDDPSLPEMGSLVADGGSNWGPRGEEPRYAFNFCRQGPDQAGIFPMSLMLPRSTCIEIIVSRETEQDQDGASGHSGPGENDQEETSRLEMVQVEGRPHAAC